MRKENYLNNCTIFDKFVQDDLVKYEITDDLTDFYIKYDGNNKNFPIDIKLDALKSLYDLNLFGAEERKINVWYPVFIWNDDHIDNKFLTKEGAVRNSNPNLKSGRLGIEEFLSFKPILKNWTASEEINFSIDWILNNPKFPYYLQYGLLFWYKRLPEEDRLIDNGTRYLYNKDEIKNFPKYSKLGTDFFLKNGEWLFGVPLVKLDNYTLYRTDKDNSIFTDDDIDFNSEAIIKITDIEKPEDEEIKFYLYSKEGKNDNDILDLSTRATLWIPDGEFFSYFDDLAEEKVCYDRSTMSNSYISPSLYNTYRQIYHILTVDRPKLLDHGLDLKTSRIIKKISHVLSTSPLMSEFGIRFLDLPDIREYIKDKIENLNVSDMDEEINSVSDMVVNINQILNDNGLDNKLSQKSFNNNLVNSRKQLFKKLLSKYGGYLNIKPETEATLVYKNELEYGDDLQIQQLMFNYCNKELQGEQSDYLKVYNNQSIHLNAISVETKINEEESIILLNKKTKNNTITKSLPLSDLARIGLPSLDINIVMKNTSNVQDRFKIQNSEPGEEWSPFNYIFETQNLALASQQTETELEFRLLDLSSFENQSEVAEQIKDDKLRAIFLDPLEKISVVWESVYGPCLKFTDTNKTPEFIGTSKNFAYNYTRYDFSTQLEPKVYVYKTGEYKIKCTINTANGVFVKTKTFYVVVGVQKVPEGEVPFYGYYTDIGENDPISIFKYDGENQSGQQELIQLTLKPPSLDNVRILNEAEAVSTGSDHLKIICPTMTDIAINKIGMFWPRKTELSYASEDFTDGMQNFSLSGEDKFFFGETGKDVLVNDKNSNLKISYSTNNTKISISKLILKNIRNETQECSQCLSFYKPIMTTQAITRTPITITNPFTGETVVEPARKQIRNIRNSKYPLGEITLIGFKKSPETNSIVVGDSETFVYPQISTKNAPPIKPYGGYDSSTVKDIGINFPNSPKLLSNLTYEDYPEVTGYRLDYLPDPIPGFSYSEEEMKICYQKATSPQNKVFEFTKGVFHPSSGWINYDSDNYESVANLSSVLKFNPGARDTFSFIGPGLYGMKSSFNNEDINKPRLYQSSIELDILEDIQWDPLIAPCDSKDLDKLKEQKRRDNQLNKEYLDQLTENSQSMKHGYRYLNGGFLKLAEVNRSNNNNYPHSDEFGFSSSYNKSCGETNQFSSSSFKYSFAVTGPAYPITKENIEKFNFRDPRVNNFAIKDIEVKLNFLNYVNTKNLVIWLDVYFSATEEKSLKGNETSAGQPIKAGKEYINQSFASDTYGLLNNRYNSFPNITDDNIQKNINNKDLSDYLDSLVMMNSKDNSPHRIYLLNQEHIQNNQYNFSLKFSDHASNFNVVNDDNSISSGCLNVLQDVVQSEYELQPTVAASGYTDRESSFYKNIIKNNQLNILNNKFAKFKNRILFETPIPETEKGPCQFDPTYDSSTRFVLNIAVLDESDEMNVYDNVSNLQLLSNYETGDNRLKSSDIYSSLCSWELILHVDDTKKPVPTTLNGINNYGSAKNSLSLIDYGKEPKYPGYNFIADLSSLEHFLPSVNFNAPNPMYYVPSEICDYANPEDKPKIGNILPPDFPEWAITAIVAQFVIISVSSGGSAAGLSALLGASNFNSGYSAIFEFLLNNKIYQEAAEKLRNFYVPKYESYPFGSPEKILLNVSKDGVFWYKLESSIFRYDNTPVLDRNKYNFIRLNKQIMPMFSDRSFSSFFDVREIIDSSFIESISLEQNECDEDILEILTNKNLNKSNVILDIQFANECSEEIKNLSGLYVIDNDVLHTISNNNSVNPANLLYSHKFIQFNNVVRGDANFITASELDENKCIILDGKTPFYMFDKDNNVEAYSDYDDESIVNTKIIKKYLIFKNNSYFTVLVLDSSVNDKSYISLKDKDCLLVFKPQQTEVLDYPINIWGFEKEKIKQSSLKDNYSLNSAGSVGHGSYQVDQELLDYVPVENNLNNLYDIFNNRENEKIKYNNFSFINNSGVIENIDNTKGCAGFSIDLIEAGRVFHDSGFKTKKTSSTTSEELDSVIDSLKYTVGDMAKNEIQLMILKCKDFEPKIIDNPENSQQDVEPSILDIPYGEITIEEDYVHKLKMNSLDQNTIDKLASRLSFLEYDYESNQEKTEEEQEFESMIGVSTKTDTIIEDGNIKHLINHYNALDKDQLAQCYDKNNKDNSRCYKKRTKQALYNAYKERDDIIKLLNEQATKETNEESNIVYIAKKDEGILENINVEVKEYEKTSNKVRSTKSLNIVYTNKSSDYYWINIDPKQTCTLANEMNPRVLVSTKYKCYYSYSNSITFPVNNNVCPRFATGGGTGFLEGIIDSIFGRTSNNDEEIDAGGTEFTYTINQEDIDQQKSDLETKYSQISGWETVNIERVFTVNNDSDIAASKAGIFIPFEDIIVEAIETYEVAIPWHKNADTFPGELMDDGSADGVDITDSASTGGTADSGSQNPIDGTNEDSASPNTFSTLANQYLSRVGLMDYTGSRNMEPNRVYNIFNLDEIQNLKVQFRKIPRMIKGVDFRNTVYRYGLGGSIFRPIVGEIPPIEVATNSSLNNLFYYWQCLQRDQYGDWKYTTLPDFYKLLNEMQFRGFYGSTDLIENKSSILESLYPWEIVPYEYDSLYE